MDWEHWLTQLWPSGRFVPLKTSVNDAFTIQTCDVRDGVKRRAALADRRVSVSEIVQPPPFLQQGGTDKDDAVSITETSRQSVRNGSDGHVRFSG